MQTLVWDIGSNIGFYIISNVIASMLHFSFCSASQSLSRCLLLICAPHEIVPFLGLVSPNARRNTSRREADDIVQRNRL